VNREAQLLSLGPRIHQTAHAFARRTIREVDTRDLEQDAWLVCLKAQRRYRGTESFATFNYLRIPGAMIDGLRRWDNRRTSRLYWESLDPEAAAQLPAVADDPDQAILKRELLAALHRLPPAEGWVLLRCFLDGVTQAQVATELGLSPSRVMQLKNQGLDQLRKELR
jgi:RNA polymerase sigma factor (sigma-70 family)